MRILGERHHYWSDRLIVLVAPSALDVNRELLLRHVDMCLECQAELGVLRRVHGKLRDDTFEKVPVRVGW